MQSDSSGSRDLILGYAVAVLAPVATTAFRLWAEDWLIGVPFILLFPSVTLAAFVGGLGPGILSLAVSAALSIFVLIEPRWSLALTAGYAMSVTVFVAVGAFQVWLVHRLRHLLLDNKRASAREHLLRRELQHRVGNLMQLIMNMTAMQARAESDSAVKAALDTFSRRAHLLMEVNRHLQDGVRAEAELLRDIAEKLKSLFPSQNVAFDIAVEDGLATDEAQRQSLALIVNELVTNALKHAFPSGGGGRIEISLKRAEPGWAVLRYGDDGAPFPPEFSVDGSARSGLKLVDALARQLGGMLEISRSGPKQIAVRYPLQ